MLKRKIGLRAFSFAEVWPPARFKVAGLAYDAGRKG